MPLFRTEVIDAKRRRLWGDVRLSQPASLTSWCAVIVGIALAIIVSLALGTYVTKESVEGYLAPEGGIVQLAASRSGRITRIFSREGDRVNAGDALVELSGETVGAQTGQVLAAQIQQIDEQLANADVRRSAAEANLEAERVRMEDQRSSQLVRRKLLERRIEDQQQLVAIAVQQSQHFEELARAGYVSTIQANERRQQTLTQRGELSSLQSELETARSTISELESRLRDIPARRQSAAADARAEKSVLEQKRIELSASRQFVERAPLAGVISSLQAEVGQVPQASAPILSIMPEGSELIAELLVPTRAAGFISIGDEVRLQVAAYPFERFGFVMGRVASISRSTIRPGDFLAPIEIREAVYRARVRLAKDYVMAYGEKTLLRPGLLLRADIVIDRKSLWRQLLDPMFAAAQRVR